jgi:small-conductance mechanosensitive channel
LAKYNIEVSNNLRARKVHTQFRLLANIIKFLIAVVAIGLILLSFEGIRQFGISILASAGIAGIILGLAAQKLIATVLAGLQLAITQPIRIDDVLIVEGEWGKVEEITLTYVVIAIWDKRRLVVPSTYFIEKPFQNWTMVNADLLGTVFIHTDYRFPVDALREELKRIVNGNPLWDEKVAIVQVTDSKERTMEMRVLVSAKDSPTAWDLRVDVREKLITFIQKEYPEMLPLSRITIEGQASGS